MEKDEAICQARRWLAEADGLLVTAGAGMGVDSGLPDFRGNEGFWRAYPALGSAGIDFFEAACPEHFERQPAQAWGFYGHRLSLYRRTLPHQGFAALRAYGQTLPHGIFVFTSNVDGQFQKAGFDPARICEIHGSIHNLQCLKPCCSDVWTAEGFEPEVDEAACLMRSPLPSCPRCGGLARPNILMFGDWGWEEAPTLAQQRRMLAWRQKVGRLLVIEIGAGVHVPTVRRFGESLGAPLIRINRDQAGVRGAQAVGLAMRAREAIGLLLGPASA